MTCVSKKYEIKTKMEQILVEGIFLGGRIRKFSDGGADSPHSPSRENLCMEGKAPPLLPHSQYICCKCIIEDRGNSQSYDNL